MRTNGSEPGRAVRFGRAGEQQIGQNVGAELVGRASIGNDRRRDIQSRRPLRPQRFLRSQRLFPSQHFLRFLRSQRLLPSQRLFRFGNDRAGDGACHRAQAIKGRIGDGRRQRCDEFGHAVGQVNHANRAIFSRGLMTFGERARVNALCEEPGERPESACRLALGDRQGRRLEVGTGLGVGDVRTGVDEHPHMRLTDPPGSERLECAGKPRDERVGLAHHSLRRPITDAKRGAELGCHGAIRELGGLPGGTRALLHRDRKLGDLVDQLRLTRVHRVLLHL